MEKNVQTFEDSFPPSTYLKALKLQKKIYQALQTEAKLLLGDLPPSIAEYEHKNQRDFRGKSLKIQSISKSELIQSTLESDVIFIADYHTFDQNQRTALRIIRDSHQQLSLQTTEPSPVIIGLEMIASHHQDALNAFQQDLISLKEFHRIIDYQEQWGFPWKNYAPLFDWARTHQIQLIALNRPSGLNKLKDEEELQKRDQWAAGIITDLFLKRKRPKIFVLYGELHVGSANLPRQLKLISRPFLDKPLSWVTLHQNVDSLFWKLARHKPVLHTEIVKLKPNIYCIFSSTPWAKLQSLINWMDGEKDKDPPYQDEAESPSDSVDYLSLMNIYNQTLSEFLEVDPPSYENISLYTLNEVDQIHSLYQTSNLTRQEMRLIEFHISNHQRVFIPQASIAYLDVPSQNGLAELAAIYLMKKTSKNDSFFQLNRDDFFRLVLERTFGFFGSLILNPNRKCDLPLDHIRRIRVLRKGQKPAFRLENEARKLAIGILKGRPYPALDLNTVLAHKAMAPALMMAAKFLGQLHGKKLHHATLGGKLKVSWIRETFLTPLSTSTQRSTKDTFENRYRDLTRMTFRARVPESKEEEL